MNSNGLWTILFASATEEHGSATVSEEINRGGVFVITNGRLYGGGISFFFTGTCSEDKDGVHLALRAVRYNDLVASSFGDQPQVDLVFNGHVTGETMSLDGHVAGRPEMQLKIFANRRTRIVD